MNRIIRVVVGLLCLPLLGLGLGGMFTPESMAETFGVVPQSINGLSTIRGIVGGLLLGTVSMIVMGLWRHNTTWFLAAALMMGTVAFGRLIGFVIDGVDMALVPPIIIELAIVVVMVSAHRKLGAEELSAEGR